MYPPASFSLSRHARVFVLSSHFCAYFFRNTYRLCVSAFDRTGPTLASSQWSQRYRLTVPHCHIAPQSLTTVADHLTVLITYQHKLSVFFPALQSLFLVVFCLVSLVIIIVFTCTLDFEMSTWFALPSFSTRSVRILWI